jgi:acyl-coenzyme A synthetase/AMP-(fatty) acid ligase
MTELPKGGGYERMRSAVRLAIPEFYNFGFDEIDRRAREADKTAFIHVARSGETMSHHSFSDLAAASNRFARVLMDLGAAKSDFAFVMIPRVPAWYEVMIGCIKAGVVAMPGTNLLTAKDIEYRINKSRAKIAIVSADGADRIEAIRARCPSLEHLILIGENRPDWVTYEDACAAASNRLERADAPPSRAADMMLAYFTSGTTAFAKMVPRDHGYALAHAVTGRYWMDLGEDDIHWTLSDTGWAKAAWGMLFPPWLMGATVVLYDGDPRFDADAHLRLIGRLDVTTFCAPPTVYRVFAQAALGDFDVVDDEGAPAADGEIGHIAVRMTDPHPLGLFHGYYADAAANQQCFRHGWYFTGDTATRDADGYIWFVGRSDDIIASAGYRISPFEVESALQEHPAVAESAVVGKPDALRGAIVKAYVIAAPGYEPSAALEKEIQDFVKGQTAPYKYPREIEFRDALPKTVSGKIRRVELRAEAEAETR